MVAGSCTAFQVLTHVALLKQALQAWGQGGRWGRVFGLLKAKHRGGNRCPSVAVPSDLLSSTVIPGALNKSQSHPCEAPLPLYQRRARSTIPSCPTSKRKIEQHLLYASAPPLGAWPCPPPGTTDAWISALQASKTMVFGRPGTEGCALDHRKSAPQASIASPAKRTTTRGPSTTSRTKEPASASSANLRNSVASAQGPPLPRYEQVTVPDCRDRDCVVAADLKSLRASACCPGPPDTGGLRQGRRCECSGHQSRHSGTALQRLPGR